MKRLIDCYYSDIVTASKKDKLEAIQASEGRTIVSEIATLGMGFHDLTIPELNTAFGADMLLFNLFDVDSPSVPNATAAAEKAGMPLLAYVRKLTGRMVGINLEPVDNAADFIGARDTLPEGRLATPATAIKAKELGADFIVLTGNPGTGVTNQRIAEVLEEIHKEVGNDVILVAGKMHAAGSKSEGSHKIISTADIDAFIDAGADIILLPAPGTVPGVTLEFVHQCVAHCHEKGVLTLTAIGTSQEDSDTSTIRDIALLCKMTGTDIHHIGDAGYAVIAPESIMTYSIAIRGKRHTYRRMAASARR